MNKGLKLLYCKVCKKKRFHSRVSIPNYNFRWTCSKGHSFVEVGVTLGRIDAATKDLFSHKKLTELFDRDSVFYRVMEKK